MHQTRLARDVAPRVALYQSTYSQSYTARVAVDMMAVAELRAQLSKVLEELQRRSQPLYITQRGQARAVLLAVAEYDALLEQLEYLDDSLEAFLAKERRARGEPTRSWEAVKRDLRRRGRLSR